MILNLALTILWIVGLVYIYKTYKADDEDFLILKMIGYYLLGAFRFNINALSIPIGFIIYMVAFKPEKNQKVKKAAAYLGLAAYVVSYVLYLLRI